jgi:hypothetical protein
MAASSPERTLDRLSSLARQAPVAGLPVELPYGFATRVLSQLKQQAVERPWEFLSLRALPVAAMITLACVLWGGEADAADLDDEDDVAASFLQSQIDAEDAL